MMDETGPSSHKEWVLKALGEYERPLLRFAWRLLGNEDAARDVVQQVFLRLCGQSHEKLEDRVAPWLFAVCRNLTIDVLRKKHADCDENALNLNDFPGKEADPAKSAEQADLHRHINRQLDALPLKQREAIALWAEGFSYREIADVAKTTEGNIRVIIHRTLKRLREHPFVVGQVSSLS